MKKLIYFFAFFLSISSYGQNVEDIGTIPSGIKWKQINTDTVRVVFPEGLESQAERLTNLIHYQAKNNISSLGLKSHKIDIFLINTVAESNGFVRPAPYHSKFFTMSSQYPFAGSVDWLDLLGIHEYRHVIQMNNSRHGVTGIAKFVFGDYFWAFGMFASVPNWFWEGDAVQQETALSHSGRGRLPMFKSRFLTIMNNKKPFGYEKMRCGSFRNYVPDHYALGYQMVNFGRRKFGNDIWRNVFSDAVAYKSIIWPFSRALENYTGYSTKEMYSQIVESYKDNNSGKAFLVNYVPDDYISEIDTKNPAYYSGPHFISKNRIIAIKSSFDKSAKFIEINIKNKKEKSIIPVSYNFGQFDTDGKKIIWSEINKNPRWAYLSHSNIYRYDIKSKHLKKLTRGKNYFSPAISPDGDKICVFEATGDMKYNILILDAKTGARIKMLDNPDNYFFSYLDWVDSNHIVSVARHNNKNAIVEIDLASRLISELVPFTYTTIQDLRYMDKKVFFSAPDLNIRDKQTLYYYDISNGKIYKFNQNENYAAFSPDLSINGKLAYCNIIFDNTVLKVKDFNTVFDKLGRGKLDRDYDIVDEKIIKEEGGSILQKIAKNKYEIKNYNPVGHLINFHSWYPLPGYPELAAVFQSNDELDKMSLSLIPKYNSNDKSFSFGTYINYGGWYPVLSLGLEPKFNMHQIIEGKEYIINYNQIKASVSIPLKYTRLNIDKEINAKLSYNISQYWNSGNEELDNKTDSYLNFELFYSNHKKSSYRSLYTDLGYDLSMRLGDLNFDYGFNSIMGYAKIYLPGIFDNHSFRLRYNFLSLSGKKRILSEVSQYYFARGYGLYAVDNLVNGLKVNYSLPLIYPDIALGKFVFVKRIRANLYFDIDRVERTYAGPLYKRSAGIEFLFDNAYFRAGTIPLGFGIDYLFDIDKGQNPINIRIIMDF